MGEREGESEAFPLRFTAPARPLRACAVLRTFLQRCLESRNERGKMAALPTAYAGIYIYGLNERLLSVELFCD